MRWVAGFASLLPLLVTVSSCHKLLGDYVLDGAPDASCAPEAVRCVENLLQRCKSEGNGWVNLAVCASETLCDVGAGTCRPPACAAGELLCRGNELLTCNPTRDGWSTLATCSTGAFCSAESNVCTSVPCQPGATECNGPTVRRCNDDSSDWTDVKTCGSVPLCNKELGTCDKSACDAGVFRCDGPALEVCNDTLNGWRTVKTCSSQALCNAEAGACGDAACTTPGAFRCDAQGVLERCADDLTAWGVVATCEGAGYCDATAGACSAEPCTPGTRQCSGARLEQCSADSTSWEPVDDCESEGLCLQTLAAGVASCVEPSCSVGDTQCVQNQPQVCSPDRTGYKPNGAACATAELCSPGSGSCAPPVCEIGQAKCKGAQPQICGPAQTGYVDNGPACASDALCNPTSGTCGDQKCVAGQLRCDPQNPKALQRCKADLTDWESTPCDVCETAELCSASLGAATCDETSCKEPVCKAGEPRCAGSGSDVGKVLEMCNAGRTGSSACATCATPELCNVSLGTTPFACSANACTAPSCGVADRWCGGSGNKTLFQCPPSRISSQATTLGTCETAGLCDLTLQKNAAKCEPPSCALTDRWCGGSGNKSLYQCPASRINTQATLLDTCQTSGLCDLTHQKNATKCEQPSCAITDRWCGGTGNKSLYQCPASLINSQATLLDTCATNGLCEAAHAKGKAVCDAPACDVGATKCAGSPGTLLQMCNAERTGFADCDVCTTAQLCTDSLRTTTCNANACLACAANEARCNAAGNYETCRADRTGFTVTDCMGQGCDAASGCLSPSGGASGI